MLRFEFINFYNKDFIFVLLVCIYKVYEVFFVVFGIEVFFYRYNFFLLDNYFYYRKVIFMIIVIKLRCIKFNK